MRAVPLNPVSYQNLEVLGGLELGSSMPRRLLGRHAREGSVEARRAKDHEREGH